MKIKHWAGYGCLNATVIAKHGGYIKDIKISGNHEMGLERPFHDEYCISRWLKRFAPKGTVIYDYDVPVKGIDCMSGQSTDFAVYRIFCKKEEQ